jgi:hypothetical protein
LTRISPVSSVHDRYSLFLACLSDRNYGAGHDGGTERQIEPVQRRR